MRPDVCSTALNKSRKLVESFVFASLPPGAYRLSAELSGFATASVDGVAVATGPVEAPVITLPLAGLSDTLVVSAPRTEEPLRDVPMSISAFSGADIERRDLEDAAELAHWTPGLTVVDQGARGAATCSSCAGWTPTR